VPLADAEFQIVARQVSGTTENWDRPLTDATAYYAVSRFNMTSTPQELLEERAATSEEQRRLFTEELMRGRGDKPSPVPGVPVELFGHGVQLVAAVSKAGAKPTVDFWLESFAEPGKPLFTTGAKAKPAAVFKCAGVLNATGWQPWGNMAQGPVRLQGMSGNVGDAHRVPIWAPDGWGDRGDEFAANAGRAFWTPGARVEYTHPDTGERKTAEPDPRCHDLSFSAKLQLGIDPVTGRKRTVGEMLAKPPSPLYAFRGWRELADTLPHALALALSPSADASAAERKACSELAKSVGVTAQLGRDTVRAAHAGTELKRARAMGQTPSKELLQAAQMTPDQSADMMRAVMNVTASMGGKLFTGNQQAEESCNACIDAEEFMGFVGDKKPRRTIGDADALAALARTTMNASDTGSEQTDVLHALGVVRPKGEHANKVFYPSAADEVTECSVSLTSDQIHALYRHRDELPHGAWGRQLAKRLLETPLFDLKALPVYVPDGQGGYRLATTRERMEFRGRYAAVMQFKLTAFVSQYGKITPKPKLMAVYLSTSLPFADGGNALQTSATWTFGYAPLPLDHTEALAIIAAADTFDDPDMLAAIEAPDEEEDEPPRKRQRRGAAVPDTD
jgi:hypothetical protein